MFKVEGKLQEIETYECICGSFIQKRNIINHFKTKKHKKFLLNDNNLIESYTKLSRDECIKKLNTYKKQIQQKKPISCPIILYFD